MAAQMVKIEFFQPKLRIEDWRVKMNGRTVGSVWRCGAGYLVDVSVNNGCYTRSRIQGGTKQLRV